MGVRRHQYAKEVEKNIVAGMSLDKAHKAAVAKSKVQPEAKTTRTGKKAPSKEGLVKKTKRRLKELWGGEKTYLPKKEKSNETTRTKVVESGLKQAGLSESDIAKFKKK